MGCNNSTSEVKNGELQGQLRVNWDSLNCVRESHDALQLCSYKGELFNGIAYNENGQLKIETNYK